MHQMLERHDTQTVTRLTEDEGGRERHEQASGSHRDSQQVAMEGSPLTFGKCARDFSEDRHANDAGERAARMDNREKVVQAIGQRGTSSHRGDQHSREV